MPRRELKFPQQVEGWLQELSRQITAPADVLTPKRKRNEPRDRAHEAWARAVGLIS
jgi:hypothetical protein